MKVPLLDIGAQHTPVRNELIAALTEVLDSGQYILGKKVEELEATISQYVDCKYGIGVTSGTDALLVALMALDVSRDDIVITSPYSFFATAGVVARLGATPEFVDIDRDSYNMSPDRLAEWFKKNPQKVSRVKAIIPVHLFGQSADLDPILEIADSYNIPVIEDAAQAIGALYPSKKGIKKVCSFGAMGCLSFFPSKNLGALGDGGMVVTNDDKLAEKVKLLRTHGAKPKYYHSMIGGNFRLAPIQAAALLVKFPLLEGWHEARRKNAEYYDQKLKDLPVELPQLSVPRECHIYNQYVIRVAGQRDELRKFLNEKNIGNEVYYPVPFHLQKCFEGLGYKQGDFAGSESAALESLAIPIYPGLDTAKQDYVIQSIREFSEKADLCSRRRAVG